MAALATLLLFLFAASATAPSASSPNVPPPTPDPRVNWPPDAGPRPAWADVPGRNPRYNTRGFHSEKARKAKRADERAALEASATVAVASANGNTAMAELMVADADANGWGSSLEIACAVHASGEPLVEDTHWGVISNVHLRQIIASAAAAQATLNSVSVTAEVAATFAATAAAAASASAQRDLPAEVIAAAAAWHKGRGASASQQCSEYLDADCGTATASGNASGSASGSASASASASASGPAIQPLESAAALRALEELQDQDIVHHSKPQKKAKGTPAKLASASLPVSEAAATYADHSATAAAAVPSAVAGKAKACREKRRPT